jgi:myo-inositol catabolism protein IolH
MVKIALDPTPYFSETDLYGLFDVVARAGYEWIHLTPHPDFIPFFAHPRADDAQVAKVSRGRNRRPATGAALVVA